MRRVIFSMLVMGMIVGMLPSPADSSEAGNDNYTYVYRINTDPATGPWREFVGIIEGRFDRTDLAAKYKVSPGQTVGKTDVYLLPDWHLTAVVYNNDDGVSTMILLIPDSFSAYPAK